VKLYSGIFEISQTASLPRWLYGASDRVACVKPGSTMYHMNFTNGLQQGGTSYGGNLESGISVSSDGLPVRWFLLKPVKRPIGLVCVAYAAYGYSTSLNTTRWRAWIEAGWAISFLLVRGGGDGNEMWADLGRLKGKKRAIDDVEICIKDLQRITGCGAKKTVLFGRSAAGLIIGNIASRWPSGNLVGIIYAEVPYVDLLKTAANPKLPLTEYEYKEFGNPRAGLVDFDSALEISPIHQLGPKGAPGIKVLCRSGLDDVQVFPYESLKWVEALRGDKKDRTKILYVDNDGHHSDSVFKEYAEDFTIINAWIK
jgi:protease II